METVFPSKSDVDFTSRIYHASKPFGFEILDHLILCDDGYYSFLSEKFMDIIERMRDYKPYKEVKPELDAEKEEAVKESFTEGKEKEIDKGKKIGEKKGRKIGLVEGEKNKAIDMAKSMLADNMDINIISKHTGLTVKEINTLRAQSENSKRHFQCQFHCCHRHTEYMK